MEEESRQKTDRKRMLGLLTVSCAATLCFAGLYVQELKTVEKLESAGQWTDTEELNALAGRLFGRRYPERSWQSRNRKNVHRSMI